tara:strand:+ start:4363 stop:5133 length:771 start_codon:yes stop_codon:yes gene_type:complete
MRFGKLGSRSRPTTVAAAPGFDPQNDVAGLMVWFEARYGVLNNADAAASNGEGIKTWNSQGDQVYSIAQASSTLRPTLNTSPGVSFNGQSVLSFDGIDDYLIATTNPAAGPIMDGAGTTTFMVWAPRDNNSHFNIPLSGGTSNGQLFFENGESVLDTSVNMMMGAGANVLTSVYTYETKYYTTLQFNGASSKHWKNRVLVGTANAGTNGSNGISVGALRTGGEPFKGYLAALLIYNGALDAAEIALVEDYLVLTYG